MEGYTSLRLLRKDKDNLLFVFIERTKGNIKLHEVMICLRSKLFIFKRQEEGQVHVPRPVRTHFIPTKNLQGPPLYIAFEPHDIGLALDVTFLLVFSIYTKNGRVIFQTTHLLKTYIFTLSLVFVSNCL
jgi:hypothetical protein